MSRAAEHLQQMSVRTGSCAPMIWLLTVGFAITAVLQAVSGSELRSVGSSVCVDLSWASPASRPGSHSSGTHRAPRRSQPLGWAAA